MIGFSGSQDGNQSASEDAHEVAESDLVFFALGAFALIEGSEFGIVLGSAKSGLEKGGAKRLDATLTHFGVTFPLAALT